MPPTFHSQCMKWQSKAYISQSEYRRSETTEQHEYEKQIHDQQVGDSSDDLESELDKMDLSKKTADGEKKGILKRIKDQIKSSFPEAVQDLKIMGKSSISHDFLPIWN